jgi:4'-phosphopantetheinyl transferase
MLKIYYVNLESIDKFAEFDFLSEYRKNKLKRITNPKLRKQGIGAELLLIEALKHNGNCPELPLKIVTNNEGKPEIEGGLYFNLSHSDDYAVCAISDSPIGVDIQIVIKFDEKLVTRYFSESENIWLDKDRDNLTFTKVWSTKESYIKLLGKGIASCPLNSFSVMPGVAPGAFAVANSDTKCWQGAIDDYILTFCSQVYSEPEEVKELRLDRYI